MRLTLNTNIIASAFRSRHGASNKLIDLLRHRRFVAPTSEALYLEYEAVVSRPEQRAVHGFTDEQLSALLNDLADRVTLVRIHYSWRPQLRDPDDELVLEAAINGRSDAIITHNVRDFLPEALRFGIAVITPGRIISQRF